MPQLFRVHSVNPQIRLLNQTVEILQAGGVIIYPTDSGYALGCCVGNKEGAERIRQIRSLSKNHNFTLVCRDLSELASYAKVDNSTFRLLKAYTPGPYTFILLATKEVPKRLQHAKRKTIGIRIPDNTVVLSLLRILQEPLMSVSLGLKGENFSNLNHRVDLIIDSGFCGDEPTTVIDFVTNGDGSLKITRKGKGDITPFLPYERNV